AVSVPDSSARSRALLLPAQRVQYTVDEADAFLVAVLLRQDQCLADRDPRRYVVPKEKLRRTDAQDVPVDHGKPLEPPVRESSVQRPVGRRQVLVERTGRLAEIRAFHRRDTARLVEFAEHVTRARAAPRFPRIPDLEGPRARAATLTHARPRYAHTGRPSPAQ